MSRKLGQSTESVLQNEISNVHNVDDRLSGIIRVGENYRRIVHLRMARELVCRGRMFRAIKRRDAREDDDERCGVWTFRDIAVKCTYFPLVF